MPSQKLHPWNVSLEEAVEIQDRLRPQLDLQSEQEKLETVAGIDVSYDKGSDWLFSVIVILRLPRLQLIHSVAAICRSTHGWTIRRKDQRKE